MKTLAVSLLGALALVFAAHADFLFWLDGSSRSNPADPKSPAYRANQLFFPTSTPFAPASPTPIFSATLSWTPSATPTVTTAPLSNGSWPLMSTFNLNVTGNNAGGTNGVGNDNQDGCGASASSAAMAASTVSPVDGSQFLRMTYNVATNAGCGYQYASVALPFVSQNPAGRTTLDFAIRSSATVRIMLRTATNDACLGGTKNRMWFDLPSTGGAWQLQSLFLSAFTLLNGGCPFPLSDADFVAFNIESPGSGQLDLDNVAFGNAPPPTATPSPTPAGSNGIWPMLSNFDFNVTTDNAAGASATSNDTLDGCGVTSPPGSSAAALSAATAGKDSSLHLQFDFDVVANPSCGYSYGSYDMALVSPRDISAYNTLRFWIRGTTGLETYKIKITTASDPCVPGKNNMFIVLTAPSSWTQVALPFSSFSNNIGGCPYIASGNLARVDWVSFLVDTPSTGTLHFDDVEFTFVAPPTPTITPTPSGSNGTWPSLSTFGADISSNNAGGVNSVGNDNDDGCGASASSASFAQSSASPVDATPYLRMSYNVATNAGCGYQYASVAFPFVSQNLTGKSSIDFAIRSTATVRIMIRTAAVDACLGARNRMWIDIPSTAGAWQALNQPFSAFTLLNMGCPYPLNDVEFVAFNIENVGSGTVDLDNISFP